MSTEEKINFNTLMKLLSKHGLECSKLVKTSDECVMSTHGLFHGDVSNYSCIDAAPFVTLLFTEELDVKSSIHFEQLKKYKLYDDLRNKSFQNMHITWFHIDNDLGAHECNLIYISSKEIYFIDYYMETERDQLFRVIKFKDRDEAISLIQKALYEQDEQTFDDLFDFQPTADKNRYNVSTGSHIFKIKELPKFSRLQSIWKESEPILEKDLEGQKKVAKRIDFKRDFWDKFEEEVENYDFKVQYSLYTQKLEKIYEEYYNQLKNLEKYYKVY
jgi:hypothetical protein